MKKQSWLAILISIWAVVPLNAHNNFYIPGDAFFSVSLSREVIKRWTNNKTGLFTFDYCRFDGEFMACGNLGYSKLQLSGITTEFRDSLLEAYWRYENPPVYRQEGDDPDELTQINSVVALIYNADFSGPLGLRLNEDWEKQGDGVYGGIIKDYRAVVADWRLGSVYPPLEITNGIKAGMHLLTGEGAPGTINQPLYIDCSRIKILLVGHSEMKGFFPVCPNLKAIHDPDAEFISYIEVTGDGFTEHSLDERYSEWKKNVVKVPVPLRKSQIPKSERPE